MSDQLPNDQYDETLREALQPARLSPRQRRRHLDRIARAADRSWRGQMRRHARLEFAVVALALLAVVIGAYVWSVLPDSGGGPDTQEQVAGVPITPDGTIAAADEPTPDIEAPPLTPPALETVPGFEMQEGLENIVSGVCDATPYAKSVPPSIAPGFSFPEWYGVEGIDLWFAPAELGAFRPGSSGFESGGMRWFAGAPTVIQWHGAPGPLRIVGERTDGQDNFEAEVTDNSAGDAERIGSFTIPTPGCWTITAIAGDAELSVVVEARPAESRPDRLHLEQLEALRPYPVPTTCPATALSGPEIRGNAITYRYWIESGGVAIDVEQVWHVAGRPESMNIVGAGVTEDVEITARLLDGSGEPLAPESYAATEAGVYGIMVFPNEGCWELTVDTGMSRETFVLYVYPADCAPAGDPPSLPPACQSPSDKHSKPSQGLQARGMPAAAVIAEQRDQGSA